MPDQPVTLEEMTLLPDNLLQALENFRRAKSETNEGDYSGKRQARQTC